MGPESKFIQSVHRALGPVSDSLYRAKMQAGDGVPDFYYEGPSGTLWIEYKVHPNKPTKRQEKWIERARTNHQEVWVATLLKDKTVRVEVDVYDTRVLPSAGVLGEAIRKMIG